MDTRYEVYYVNSNGDDRVTTFNTWEGVKRFLAVLDKRIEKGTCGGYVASRVTELVRK